MSQKKSCITCGSSKTTGGRRPPIGYCSRECADNAPVLPWSPALAYLAGLIASDGCLKREYGQRSCMAFTSTEPNLIKTVEHLIKINSAIPRITKPLKTQSGKDYWQVRWTNHQMYQTFLEIGLSEKKSLTMPALSLPIDADGKNHFWLFFRGLLDGDGSIPQRPDDNFASVRIISGAPLFLRWLQKELRKRGVIHAAIIRSSHNKEAEILQIQLEYIPLLCDKMFAHYPQFDGLGHPEKNKRLLSRMNNISARPHVRKMKRTREKIETSMLLCHDKLGRWPNTIEYDNIRKEQLQSLSAPRDFPMRSALHHHFDDWKACISWMEEKYPERKERPFARIELSLKAAYDHFGYWPSSTQYQKWTKSQRDISQTSFPLGTGALFNVFSSWDETLSHMKNVFSDCQTMPLTTKDLFDQAMKDFHMQLGRFPGRLEYDRMRKEAYSQGKDTGSIPNSIAAISLYGSWKAACTYSQSLL